MPNNHAALPPTDRPMSSLDGFKLIRIDTDPDPNLYMTVAGLHAGGLEVVGVLPVKFLGTGDGYLVVSYDRSKDPRATP